MQNTSLLDKTGIRRVHFYIAPGPVETCDRCNAGIRQVALVTYKDGTSQKYGSECIKKILAGAPDLRRLFEKNAKLLKRYTEALEIFNRKPEDMPHGSEYFNAGFGFIGYETEKRDINGGKTGHWFFHPVIDWEKNQDPSRQAYPGAGRYVQPSLEEYQARCFKDIEEGKAWFAAEITRIEGFLARILSKVTAAQAASLESPKE